MIKETLRLALGTAALFIFSWASPAAAAKWWNPLTWFESSDAVRAETAKYKAERPDYVKTLEEAQRTGDHETVRQARKELREFDKAHDKRVRELRKQTHVRLRLAHTHDHRTSGGKGKGR